MISKVSLILMCLFVLVFMVSPFVAPVLAQDSVSQFESPVVPGDDDGGRGLAIDWGKFIDDLFSAEEPGSMVQAVEMAIALLFGLFSLGNITEVIVNSLKKINWGFLTFKQKEKLGGEIAEVIVYLVATGLTYATTHWLLPLAEQIDTLGIFGIGLAVWAFARTIYFSRKPNA